jgi:hypothetical protein
VPCICFALQQTQSSARFIGVAPFIADVEQLAAPDQSQVHGYVIYGDADHGLARIREILERSKYLGVEHQTKEVAGLGHEFPPQFDRSPQKVIIIFGEY